MDARAAADGARPARQRDRRAPRDPARDGGARPDPAKLRAAAVPVAGGPACRRIFVLAPHDMVLHSAVHLFFGRRIRPWPARPVRHPPPAAAIRRRAGFWDGLAARARELQLARPLFYALRYAARLLGTPVPDAVLRRWRGRGPGPVLLALMDRLFLRALLPATRAAKTLTAIARHALYVRGNWLRMPPLLLSRHLFHKAFISPASGGPALRPVTASDRQLASAVRIAYY
jgi:hypothetical protein